MPEVFDIDSSPERPPRYPQVSQQVDGPDDVFDFDANLDSFAPLAKPVAPVIPTFTPIILPPGSFTVRLVLDTREVRTKKDRDYISSQLANRGMTALTRALPWATSSGSPKCILLTPTSSPAKLPTTMEPTK